MSSLLKHIQKSHRQLILCLAVLSAVVLGWPLVQLNNNAHANNPAIGLYVEVYNWFGESVDNVDAGNPSGSAVDGYLRSGGGFMDDGNGGTMEVDSIVVSVHIVGPGADGAYWNTYCIDENGNKTLIATAPATVDSSGNAGYNAPFGPDCEYICVELIIPPHGVCWRGYFYSVKACLTVCDLVTDANGAEAVGECKTDGETLKLTQDAAGCFKFKLIPEVVPHGRCSDYTVKVTGIPEGATDVNGDPIFGGERTFTACAESTFVFSLPESFIESKETAELIALIDKVEGSEFKPVCQVYLNATDCETCRTCAAGNGLVGEDAQNGVIVTMDAGDTENGRGGANTEVSADDIDEFLASPESLSVNASAGATATYDGSGVLQSLATKSGTIKVEDVVVPTGSNVPSYTLKFYHLPAGGSLSTTAATQVKVSLPAPKTLRVVEQRFKNTTSGSATYVEQLFTQNIINDKQQTWTLYEGAEVDDLDATNRTSDFLRKTVRERTEEDGVTLFVQPSTAMSPSPRVFPPRVDIVTISERRADTDAWEVISKTREVWAHYPWGLTLVRRTAGYGTEDLTTSWSYYVDQSHGNAVGRLRGMQRYDGYWEEYEYDTGGRLSKRRRPFLDSAIGSADNLCDVTTWEFGAGTSYLVHKTQTILGTAVADVTISDDDTATDTVRTRDSEGGSAPDTTETVEQVKPTCVSGTTQPPADSGEVTRTAYPDGTETQSTFSYDGNDNRIETTLTGAVHSGVIDAGMKTVVTRDLVGNPTTTVTTALDAGGVAGTSLELMTVSLSNLDVLSRPLTSTTAYADSSPSQVSTILYSCCGIANTKDVRGVLTEYLYDHLRRQETSTSLGVTTGTQFNGLRRKTVRIPEADAPTNSHGHITVRDTLPTSTIVQGESQYSVAGEHVASRSPSPQHSDGTTLQTTTYDYDYTAGTTVTVDYADGGESVSTTYLDGRAKSVTGDAVNDVSYGYGLTGLAGVTFANGGVLGTKVIQANGTQWTISVVDQLGRGVQTHFADGAKSESFYNSLNQLVRSIDPDGATALFGYNDEGQRIYQGADLNGNGTLQTASDRVTFTETNANTAHDSTTRAWETVSEVYGTSGGSLSTGKSQRSVDGLKSWSIPFEITARVATSTTVLKVSSVDGNWTTTSVSPTGLTSVSTYTAGLLRSSVTKGANGTEILSNVSYPNTGVPATDGYDAHNRVIRANDLRTGDTTVAYFNNDQPSSVTQVRAGTDSLVTAYTYDVMGRTHTTDSPNTVDDQSALLNNIVTNTYDKRGNVLTVVGDQTYQRDYTYDGLSRLITLKTYGTSTSVTTWNYHTQRGWLDSKDYPDPANPLQAGDGPSYTYTDGGRLKTRLWARSVSTTYRYDFEGND